MKISVIQFKSRLGDIDTNIERTVAFVKDAIKEGAELCLFPELSLTGYNLQDLTFEVALKRDDKRLIPLLELSRKAGIIVGLIEEDENHVFYNAAFYLKDGEINIFIEKSISPLMGCLTRGDLQGAEERLTHLKQDMEKVQCLSVKISGTFRIFISHFFRE